MAGVTYRTARKFSNTTSGRSRISASSLIFTLVSPLSQIARKKIHKLRAAGTVLLLPLSLKSIPPRPLRGWSPLFFLYPSCSGRMLVVISSPIAFSRCPTIALRFPNASLRCRIVYKLQAYTATFAKVSYPPKYYEQLETLR